MADQTEQRHQVKAFAALMEARLSDHDADRGYNGWANNDAYSLYDVLTGAARGLLSAFDTQVQERDYKGWAAQVAKKAADVGNYAMMIADVTGSLPEPINALPSTMDNLYRHPAESRSPNLNITFGIRQVPTMEPASGPEPIPVQQQNTDSDIYDVSYERLVTHGHYENTRIGARAVVSGADSPEDALGKLGAWVNDRLQAIVGTNDELMQSESQLMSAKRELNRTNADLAQAKQRWEAAKKFLASHGLPMPGDPNDENMDEIPF